MLNNSMLCLISFVFTVYASGNTLPSMLVEDLHHEVLESDFISLDSNKRNELINKIKLAFNVGADHVYSILQDELSNELPHFQKKYEVFQIQGTKKNDYTILQPLEKLKLNGAHAIHDLKSYSQNRMGHGTTRFLSETKGEIIIIASNTSNFTQTISQTLDSVEWTLMPIPSLYEHWGIRKFYAQSVGHLKLNKIIWIIPPSIQYLQHYVNTFGLYSKTKVKGYFDHQSADQFRSKILEDVNTSQISKSKIDYLIFGYQRVWEKYLKSDLKNLVLEHSQFDIPSAHSNISLFKIKSDQSTNGYITIGLFSTNSTLWGELINTYIPSFFHAHLKGVIFMGSAGSLDPDIKVYDLSVPISIVRAGKKIKIPNLLVAGTNGDTQLITTWSHIFACSTKQVLFKHTSIKKNRNY